jgi:hypothetical protein
VHGFDKTDFKRVYNALKSMYLSDCEQLLAEN